MKKLAFIFAHPDDAEIWAGGTILNHVIAHDEIKIIYTYVNNEERKNEAKTLEKLPHTTVEILDSPRLLRRVLKEYNPDIIVTHWEKDAHPEHRATYQLLYEQIPSLIIKEHLCFNLYVCDTYNSIGSSNSELFIPNVFTNLNPSEFVSNGSIILHYVPLLLCISLLCRFMFHYLATEVLKGKFKRKINIINNKTFVFNNWLFIISIVLIVVGLGLDYFERKNEPVNDEIISLADLGYPGDQKTYDTCITSSSFLIDNSVSYSETNGEEIIKVNYYQYSDKSKATQGLENYQSSINYSFKKEISNGYLLGEGEEEIYNVIAFVKDNQLIVLQSNLDLLSNNLYETVIEKA